VILVNSPYKLDADLGLLMPALGKILSPRATIRTDWLAPAR